MTRALSTTILGATLLIVTSAPLAAQTIATGQLRAAPTFAGRAAAPAPDRISLINVENRLAEVGGLYVHMALAQVDEVLSPRLFTLRRANAPNDEQFDKDARVLLLLDSPQPAIARGRLVQVTGWIGTVGTASTVLGRDWGAKLDDAFFADADRPLVVANIVRSADGVELASRR